MAVIATAVSTLASSIPAGLSTALSLGGTALGAVGTIQQANATASAARHSAAVADRDAFVADQNRKLALEQGRIDAEDKRREDRRILSSIRAAYGSSGLELAGSPLDVLEDTSLEQELGTRRVEFESRARGREGALQMLGLSENAALDRNRASSAKRSGFTSAVGVGLSGVGTTLSRVA